MALPYLVLTMRPGLVRRLPRTGPGSVVVKEVMGLLMLAAAAYFIGVGITAFLASPGEPPGRFHWWPAMIFVDDLSENVSAIDLQAATGLLAVVVLLTVMNWFFHKIYWGGWISLHNRRKRKLINRPASRTGLWWGLGLLGFTTLYREGFEVVLFLQSYRLRLGGEVVLAGTVLGLILTGVVAVLNFWAHRRLPYRKMLVLTGLLLGVVLLVMVGEEAQEMQLAHWLPTTPIESLGSLIPGWMELWFAVFPTVETISAQLIAGILVVGSYLLATRQNNTFRPDTSSV